MGDVNGDGNDDVVSIESVPVNLHLISGDGPPPRWSKNIEGYAVAVGDITGDEKPEVIAGAFNSTPPSAGRGNLEGELEFVFGGWAVYVFDKDGNLLWAQPTNESIKDIEIGDIDNDGIDDVLACTSSAISSIYAFNGTGHSLPGWPVTVPPPGLGKPDSDEGGLEGTLIEEVIDLAIGQLDGKVGVDVAGIGPSDGCLYVFNSTGGLMWSNDISGRTVEIGNVDGDDDNKVVAVDYAMEPTGGLGIPLEGGWVLAFDGDEGGPPLYGFYTEDGKIISDIELGDLDGNPKDVEVAAITMPNNATLFAIDIDSPPAGQEMWRYSIDWFHYDYYGESLAIGDVDRDYKNEVIAASSEPDHCIYAFDGVDRDGDGEGDLVWSPYCVDPTPITDVEVGDLDGDGDDDVAFGTVTAFSIHAITAVESKTGTATGTGTVYFDSDPSTLEGLTAVAESELPEEGKPDLEFPHGFFSFNITLPPDHTSAIVTMTFPSPLPVGTQYWKYHEPEGWIDVTSLLGDDDGDNVLTLTLTDGGLGDDDGAQNGVIVDQGGPGGSVPPVGDAAYPVSKAPLLAPWIALGLVLGGGISWYVLRRRKAQS